MKSYIAFLWGIGACGAVGCLELNTTPPDGAGGGESSSSTTSNSSSGMSSSGMSSSGASSSGASSSGTSSSGMGSSSSSTSSTSSSSGSPNEICGNGKVESGEECDDGNVTSGDGCNGNCWIEKTSSLFIGTPGQPGYTDGIGSAALLSGTTVLAIYGDEIYLGGATVVRVVNINTKVVTTIAGNGNVTGQTDAPVGSNARFNNINGLATDGTTLWVADTGNFLLRAISLVAPYGVTTVAGSGVPGIADGIALNAQFDYIRGMTYHNGYVYILEANSSVLRRFDPSTGEVKTLAGTPNMMGVVDGVGSEARFTSPRYVVGAGPEKLYISDIAGATVRQYDIPSTTVTTVAGNGVCGYVDGMNAVARLSRPRGIAYDGQNVFWSEAMSNTIRRSSLTGAYVGTISGSPNACAVDCSCPANAPSGYAEGTGNMAQWSNPYDIVYHAKSKSFFISDAGNSVLRRLQ